MSIWSTVGGVDGLYEVGRGPLGEPEPDTWLDLAEARSWYGSTALRVALASGDEHARAVLSRAQVVKLIEDLQGWLAYSAGEGYPANGWEPQADSWRPWWMRSG